MFANKELVMGFGHRVYKKGDPRNPIIKVSIKLYNSLIGMVSKTKLIKTWK